MKTYRAIVLLGCVLLALATPFAFSQESDSSPETHPDEIQSRGLSIVGCELKYKSGIPDFNALKNCVNGKIDKIHADAKKATDAVKTQAQGLQSELNNLKNSPFLAKLDGERRMLEAVRTLNLEPFFTCLAQSQSLQPQFTSRIQLLASNPGKFAADLTNEIWTIAQQRSQALMAEHLQALRTSGGPGDLNQVADRSIRLFTQLANEHPVTRCITPRLNSQIALIKQTSLQLAPQMEAKLKQTFDQVFAPVLKETVGKALGTMLKNLTQPQPASLQATVRPRGIPDDQTTPQPAGSEQGDPVSSRNVPMAVVGKGIQFLTPDEIETVANGIAFQHIFTKDFAEARAHIDQLNLAASNPATSQVALTRLRQVLTNQDVIPEVLRFEVGHAILRFAGHKFIDCSLPNCGGDLVVQMLGASALLKDVVVEIISAVCSLADIVGGGVCGVGETVTPNAIYDSFVLPAIQKAAIFGLHGAFDGVMNLHHDALLKGFDPRTRSQQNDPFMALLNLLPTKEVVVFFADSQVREMHTAFKTYNASVLKLAEVATRR
jgi:hypothetical protein